MKKLQNMATFTPYIYSDRPSRDGSCRVYIRLTHNRQSVYIATPYYVTEKARKGRIITDRLLLSELDILMNAYTRKMILLDVDIDTFTAKELAGLLQAKEKKEKKIVEKKPDRISFSQSCYDYIQSMCKEGRERTASNYLFSIRHLEKFFGGMVYADQLTTKNLQDFERYMKGNGIGSRGINMYMINLKRMFKETCHRYNDYDTGVMQIKSNPWERYTIPPVKYNKRTTLNEEQIRKMAALELSGRPEFARDMFLLSFYLAGMNTVDMYHSGPVTGERLEYNRRKTKGQRQDNAFFSILVQPEVRAMLDKYKHPERLIGRPFSGDYDFNRSINIGLKKVGELIGVPGLNHYVARHSFATIARNRCGVSKDDIGMALNHTDEEHKTTDIYLEKDWTIVDRVVRKVLDYVFEARESIR